MPGIAGLIAPQERDTLPSVLSGMVWSMRADDAVETLSFTAGEAGLASIGIGARMMLAAHKGVCLAVSGMIVPDERLESHLGFLRETNFSQGCTARCLLELYLQLGPRALEGLNGKYTAAVWDGPRQRMVIITGRSGTEPLYYWHSGSRLIFASRLSGLAAHPHFPRQLNPVAVMDLLATGQMLDDRTLYAHAQALPPAACATFEHGQLSIETYWQPGLFAPGDPEPDESSAMEELVEKVRIAVKRQLSVVERNFSHTNNCARPDSVHGETGDCQIGLLLTGGLDSRLLAGTLMQLGESRRTRAATIGHNLARDVRYGRQIAQAAGIGYTVIPANPRFLADYAAECIRRTDGGMNLHASWILGASRFLLKNGMAGVMTGVGAETISGRYWLSEQDITTREQAVNMLCGCHWNFSQAAALIRAEQRDALMETSQDSLRRTLVNAPSNHLTGWADYLAFCQQIRHPTGNILSDDTWVLEPFFDNDLLDFAYRLPFSMRAGGDFYKKMIVQHFPDMASIGYTDSGMLLSDEVKGYAPVYNFKSGIIRFYRKATRRTARQLLHLKLPVITDNPTNAILQNTWLRTYSRPFAMRLIKKQELYADLLDAQQVRQLFDDHMSGRVDAYRLVSAVLTLIMWRDLAGV